MKDFELVPPDVEPDLGPPSDPNPLVRKFGLGPAGARCKSCALLFVFRPGQNRYFKCRLRKLTHGPGSDHRANWNACAKYEAGDV